MLKCKRDKFTASGKSTHPGAHSVVDSLPSGESSGLHHENQQVDHRPAEPVNRHETCKATDAFVNQASMLGSEQRFSCLANASMALVLSAHTPWVKLSVSC